MKIYTPESHEIVEEDWERPSIFLAGTIDTGNSVDWRTETINRLTVQDVNVFNPQCDRWDASWIEREDNEQFRSQVEWELRHLRRADVVFVNILPDSKSPITLLEFGLFIHKCVIVCPDEFYRSGNIHVTAKYFDTPYFKTYDEGFDYLNRLFERKV